MVDKEGSYYEARGFSVYYFANVIFNIVSKPFPYIRGIEDILGDMRTEFLMQPFKKYTNLHEFIRCIALDLILEDIEKESGSVRFLQKFLKAYNISCPSSALESSDDFSEFMAESEHFHDAIDAITEEIFHILFGDIGFLQAFNKLCAEYIGASGFGETYKTRSGTLKRASLPVWARRAIFHRDKGECRTCKRSLATIINQLDTERYDHIVPLARFGANDITNLQLLCESCNLEKSAHDLAVSRLYQKAVPK